MKKKDPEMPLIRAVTVLAAATAVMLASPRAFAQSDDTLAPGLTTSSNAEAPQPSPLVEDLARWAVRTGDNADLPYIVVDKMSAQVFVYGATGELVGATPALIGLAYGDFSVPGIGERELRDIAEDERTTPAGRFRARYGPAAGGGKTLWVDFGTALSLHPVVTTNRTERRLQRLASPSVEDNRITYGCINVPKAFYAEMIKANFRADGGVVYILPDSRPIEDVFPTFWHSRQMASVGPTPAR